MRLIKGNTSKAGQYQLYADVNGRRIPSGVRLSGKWSSQRQTVVGRGKEAQMQRDMISLLQSTLTECRLKAQATGASLIDVVLNELKGEQQTLQFSDYLNHVRKKGVGEGTWLNLRQLQQKLPSALTTQIQYDSWLRNLGVSPATARKHVANLRAYHNWLRKQGCDVQVEDYHLPKGNSEHTHLTREEVSLIASLATQELQQNERKAQQSMILLCQGVRWSDLPSVLEADTSQDHIQFVSQKTNLRQALMKTDEILRAIAYLKEEGLPTSQSFNRSIKTACRLAGITQEITLIKGSGHVTGPKWKFISSHTGRRTFFTLSRQQGLTERDVMNLAGYTTSKMVVHYDKTSLGESLSRLAGSIHK